MAAAIGWYGLLIDLSKASSYVGDYVQLLVFVHKPTPVQYKIARNGGEVQMGSQVLAGHVFLLQNLKISRFEDAVEARALHCSSLQCLLYPIDFASSKCLDELIAECCKGITAKDKLQKHRRQLKVNWKVHEETYHRKCSTLSELFQCIDSCKTIFHACVGEIFLPITWVNLQETEAERMFVSRRLQILGETSLADDIIATGCELCGTPVDANLGSSDRLHVVGNIYRPFLHYEYFISYGYQSIPFLLWDGNLNFCMIWLILLNMLFQHGKNSPLKFKVVTN
ncbi:hypothetical protein CDL12_02494 [Handroanthus impetiginosus]|uniref:Uncharacterized protein n=1 Tax=Handroanthus impetiginosus TaxID=429701 RepID=A0A2G9I579_9LAMI|nr:hypothetical protein CDL12_02494 [Handroanthus impetiginosus]